MELIRVIDRLTGREVVEKVYGERFLKLVYGSGWGAKTLGRWLLRPMVRCPLFSWLYGQWQKLPFTRRKVIPFVRAFDLDPSEFETPVDSFGSFNDFFVRKLKAEARPIASGEELAIVPSDGRYRVFPEITSSTAFSLKGERFCLSRLLQDAALASTYEGGSMVVGRLCPSDAHRFVFPVSCIPERSSLIRGGLSSVNPWATRGDLSVFVENKRVMTPLKSEIFGTVLFLEIGATNVGSVIQTFLPGVAQKKGDEKGYFSFGASAIVLLFQPSRFLMAPDLVGFSYGGKEVLCRMGQVLGTAMTQSRFFE